MKPKYRYQCYQQIYESTPKILEETRRFGASVGADRDCIHDGHWPV